MSEPHPSLDPDQGIIEAHPSPGQPFPRVLRSPALWVFVILLITAFAVGEQVTPTWTADRISLDLQTDAQGPYFIYQGKQIGRAHV